ncbi:MAG: hypothetical protein L3V56_09000 [Candidatus Magnetoovum sp. WYHC-5]|nr:hypothetical protein [Candidatus Magnetoovum sp. WYHC-5]
MQHQKTTPNKFIIVCVFAFSYVLFILFWISIKNGYGHFIAKTATFIAYQTKDIRLVSFATDGESSIITIAPGRFNAIEELTIDVKVSGFTFNTPLTFAIVAAFYPIILSISKCDEAAAHLPTGRFSKFSQFLVNASGILIIIHLLYIYSLIGFRADELMVARGYKNPDNIGFIFMQFLWLIADNMLIRFEPFIIGMYLYLKLKAIHVKISG